MIMVGLVNVARCCGDCVCRAPAAGGALVRVGAVVLLGVLGCVLGYRGAEAVLLGLRESTAEANLVAAWAVAVVLTVAALVAGAYITVRAYRAPREQALVAAHAARVDRALEQRRAAAISPSPARLELPVRPARVQVAAQRVDGALR